jgi:hypothetical protein
MNALVIFVLILGPITALLLWVVFCEVRGVPAFSDATPPEERELDVLGRWILAFVCLGLAAIAFAVGGLMAVILVASVIAALAGATSLVWTLSQNARHAIARRRAVPSGAATAPELRTFHRRFARNFRHTIIRLPVALVAYG